MEHLEKQLKELDQLILNKILELGLIEKNEMVFVKTGTFLMGSSDYDAEKPQHEVTLSRDFLMGKYPVTQALYESVMGNNPSHFKGAERPVEKVSWYDAVEFCNKLSEMEGLTPVYSIDKTKNYPNNTNDWDYVKWLVSVNLNANGYRLPTEAEWEFAARGGVEAEGFEYAGSDDLKDVGWFYENSGEETHPVGQFTPNELGIYDMSGNVREWCWDWWSDNYLNSNSKNPSGASSGSLRVYRGGSWFDGTRDCRVAFRSLGDPHHRGRRLGFRVCRSIL